MDQTRFPENTVFGLDIGTRSVVGTVGYRKPSGEFVIFAQNSVCHETRAMLDGQIHDIGKVTDTVCKVKFELEKELNTTLDTVCIAAAGRVLKTVNVRMDYDLGDEMPITEDMIYSMELMGMEQANRKLHADEKDGTEYICVGYSIVRYYLGNVQFTNLEGHRGKVISADVLATFLPKDVIDGLYSVCTNAGLRVLNITLEPIAAMNIAIPDRFRLLNLALVDIGAGTSDICITKEGSIIGYGMLPCAGDFLTESIMYELMTDFNTAEKVKLQVSGKRKKITYTDVMGTKQSVESSKIREILQKPFEKLTTLIADKIRELNGGEKVGAVFIVGGGGKNPDFAGMLAEAIGLPEQRVALRGEEVFSQIVTPDKKPMKDPMMVTPIGICMNFYEQNNNFILIKFNGVDIKLYNNGKLNVMDAVISFGMSEKDVFPKRGQDLKFTVNGKERCIKGKKGDSSVITVNGEEAGITTPIKLNDHVTLKASTMGEAGKCTVGELEELKNDISFIVNGKKAGFPKLVKVNGKMAERSCEISEGDEINIYDYYPMGILFDKLEVSEGFTVTVNNREIDLNGYDREEKLYDSYIIDIELKKPEIKEEIIRPVEKEPAPVLDNTVNTVNTVAETEAVKPSPRNIQVTVNNTPVRLFGKPEYAFVDVLDFYPFSTSSLQGIRIVCKRNGVDADFFTKITNGDILELYWSD